MNKRSMHQRNDEKEGFSLKAAGRVMGIQMKVQRGGSSLSDPGGTRIKMGSGVGFGL